LALLRVSSFAVSLALYLHFLGFLPGSVSTVLGTFANEKEEEKVLFRLLPGRLE
jgi:hypothetical protein